MSEKHDDLCPVRSQVFREICHGVAFVTALIDAILLVLSRARPQSTRNEFLRRTCILSLMGGSLATSELNLSILSRCLDNDG